jgi:hypothetical protein
MMTEQKDILYVLAAIAKIFNKEKIHWALGASLLLYFHHKTDTFHDIDLMVTEEDAQKARELLLKAGAEMQSGNKNEMYRTKFFFEFVMDDVDIDLMAGMIILHDGIEEDCSLDVRKIESCVELEGERIPLYSLAEWRRFYSCMGRDAKVAMIDGQL